MLAIQSDIAKYRCLYSQGAVAFQTPGVFSDSPGTVKAKLCTVIYLIAAAIPGKRVLCCVLCCVLFYVI